MKGYLVKLAVVAGLLWAGSAVMAQGKGKGKASETISVTTTEAKQKGKDTAAEAKEKAKANVDKEKKDAAQAGEKEKKVKAEAETAKKKADEKEAKVKSKAKEKTMQAGVDKMNREEAKHRRRVAKLERIREILKEKGNDQAVAQLDEALKKENTRYDRAMTRLQQEDKDAAAKFKNKLKEKDEAGRQKAKETKEKAEDIMEGDED